MAVMMRTMAAGRHGAGAAAETSHPGAKVGGREGGGGQGGRTGNDTYFIKPQSPLPSDTRPPTRPLLLILLKRFTSCGISIQVRAILIQTTTITLNLRFSCLHILNAGIAGTTTPSSGSGGAHGVSYTPDKQRSANLAIFTP